MEGVGKNDISQVYRGDYISEIAKLRGMYWMNDENMRVKTAMYAGMTSEKGISYGE